MTEMRYSVTSVSSNRDIKQRTTLSRLLGEQGKPIVLSLLVGIAITLLLSGIEIAILWIFNPQHVLGVVANQRLSAFLAILAHTPLLLLVPLIEMAGGTLMGLLSTRPLTLLIYLQEVRKANERYGTIYTPLSTLANVYATPVSYYQHTPGSIISHQALNLPIFDLLEDQDTSLVLLGSSGAGKTITLRSYQYAISRQGWARVRSRRSIPLYIPLQHYSLFLAMHQQTQAILPGGEDAEEQGANSSASLGQETLLDFLYVSTLPGMSRLRPYLKKLIEQGRFVFLCDGLDEVDLPYRVSVGKELANLVLTTRNRFVITCREGDYPEQRDLIELENEGHLGLAVIEPLQLEQVREFVERFVSSAGTGSREAPGNHWQHTAGQIMQRIDHSRLRYLCANPMILFTLLEVVDDMGVERSEQLDTRGRLLRELVNHLMKRAQERVTSAPIAHDVLLLLSRIACAARWSNDCKAIQLPVSDEHQLSELDLVAVSDALLAWLEDYPAYAPFAAEIPYKPYDRDTLVPLLQFAQNAALIDIIPGGALSFRHELIVEYFVAAYFLAHDNYDANVQMALSPLAEQLLTHVEDWSESVALWAGLLDDPRVLAERFIALARSNPPYALQALALSLLCTGVAWRPPQAETQQENILPRQIAIAVSSVMRNSAAREEFAYIFTRCADEGGQEIYRSLLPLLMIEGIDELLSLLDPTIVCELLFSQLSDTVDMLAYETQVKRLCRLLGRLGNIVVPRAAVLSQAAPTKSIRLQAAAINILGGTSDLSAVEPLIARLSDTEQFIVNRAINALVRLGPDVSVRGVSQVLENRTPGSLTQQTHNAALTILSRFLNEQDARRQVNPAQYQHILETIILTLSSSFASEPTIQQQAKEILVQHGQIVGAGDPALTVVTLLTQSLSAKDDMLVHNVIRALQEIGSAATPSLLEILNQQPADIVSMRIVEVLKVVHDPRALPDILHLATDPSLSPPVQQQATSALDAYTPDSIAGLIELVLSSPGEFVADKAAYILGNMGEQVVVPMIQALSRIVSLSGDANSQGSIAGEEDIEAVHIAQTLETKFSAESILPDRTRLLVQVLERVPDARAIAVLISLLKTLPTDALLTVAVIHVLRQFRDKQVVALLLDMLADSRVQIYEEAIDALSSLGEIALDELIRALDVTPETTATPRVRRALLGMLPFPAERLLEAARAQLTAPNGEAMYRAQQIQQIQIVLRVQGADAAEVLVRHLFDENTHLRDYVRQTLAEMPAHVVVPALLDALNWREWRSGIAEFLLVLDSNGSPKYAEAIPPLVNLLGDPERADAAAAILPQFGPEILPSLISALDDPRLIVQEYAQTIIVALVRQAGSSAYMGAVNRADDSQATGNTAALPQGMTTSPHNREVLLRIINLFNLSLPLRAHEALLEVLTNELATVSIPALIDGLADAHLVDHVSEALARLVRKRSSQRLVLNGLLEALRTEDRRRGAETALIRIGGPTVEDVGALITDPDQSLANTAQHILQNIGVPALYFIWAAHSDTSNRARRDAARTVFQHMQTEVIKAALVELLASDQQDNISMAVALLLERIQNESDLPLANQEMIPALLDYVQIHEGERTSQRIIALLLLLGGNLVVESIIQVLYDQPDYPEPLVHALLLLGRETRESIVSLLNDPNAPSRLRAEAMSILGRMAPTQEVYEYAQSASKYGLSPTHSGVLSPDQLALSLRALGSLLASGQWDVPTLQDLQRTSPQGSAQRELFNVLLGWRYEPQVTELASELQNERDSHKREILNLTGRIVSSHERIQSLEYALEQAHHEHGVRGDELYRTTQERETFRDRLDRTEQENQALEEQITQLQAYNVQLIQEINSLRDS